MANEEDKPQELNHFAEVPSIVPLTYESPLDRAQRARQNPSYDILGMTFLFGFAFCTASSLFAAISMTLLFILGAVKEGSGRIATAFYVTALVLFCGLIIRVCKSWQSQSGRVFALGALVGMGLVCLLGASGFWHY